MEVPGRVIELPPGEGSRPGEVFLSEFSRRDLAAASVAALLAFSVYFVTAAPTVTAEDSGELAAAASTVGIPHPPGYPLYVISAKAFLTVFPFGEVAWRLNVFSALLAASAVGLAVLLALRLSAPRPMALSAGLIAAFSPLLWSQATIAEVYALSAVVFLGVIHLTILYLLKPSAVRLWTLAYACGLSVTAHPSLVLALPGVCAGVILRDRSIVRRPGDALAASGFALLGFSVYLYLPLRSLADPVMDWGNPETAAGFLDHLLRTQYAGLTEDPLYPVLDRVLYLGYVALFELGVVVTLLSAFGLGALLRFPGEGFWPKERAGAQWAFRAACLTWLLSLSVGFLFVLSVSFQKQILALNRVFFLPLLLLLVPAVALGLSRAVSWLERTLPRALRSAARPCLPALLPACFLVSGYPAQDRSGYTIARDYAEGILETLPEGAVYIPSSDHSNFPVLYLTVVEDMRPDIVLADKYGYLDPAYLREICDSEEEVERVRRMPREEADRWLIDHAGRPVFVSSKRTIAEIPPDRFLPVGILYRVDRKRKPLSPEEEERLWASYDFENLTEDYAWKGRGQDVAAELIASDLLFQRAEYHFRREEKELALRCLERLRHVARDYREPLQNAGSLLGEKELPGEAVPFYEAALELDPTYAECRRNYAWLLLSSGIERKRAIALAERSLREMPAESWFLRALGDAYREEGRYRNAIDAYRAASRRDPADWESIALAGEVVEEDLKDPQRARRYFEESLRRKPTQPELIEKLHGKEARERYERAAKRALEELSEKELPNVPAVGALEPAAAGL